MNNFVEMRPRNFSFRLPSCVLYKRTKKFGPASGAPIATNVVLVGAVVVIRFSKY